MKLKKIAWAAGVILALMILAVGDFIYVTTYRITDIDVSLSPNGEHTLLLQSVGEPDFPFGYSHVRLLLIGRQSTIVDYRFDIANDGKWTAPEDWKVKWEDTCVIVTVSGEEQDDVTYQLYYSGDVATEVPKT